MAPITGFGRHLHDADDSVQLLVNNYADSSLAHERTWPDH